MWMNLRAVKAGRVHQVSDTIWSTSGGDFSEQNVRCNRQNLRRAD
ncbi:MAG: hypothetical protein OFPII_22770 [Osedax symbiont Rs1]|nr:MAG: hypothetical protein OFPII_22770 [Osedax symbiont Rs1]